MPGVGFSALGACFYSSFHLYESLRALTLQDASCTEGAFGFLSVAPFSPHSPLGCQAAYLSQEWQPQLQASGYPSNHYSTWLLQANSEPYLTQAKSCIDY